MPQNATTSYVMPDVDADLAKYQKFWLIAPAMVIAACAFGYAAGGVKGLLDFMWAGFFVGIPLALVFVVPVTVVAMRRQKAVWADHTYDWYRKTFPEHAHAKGRVSCRHCGSEHVRAERMMNKTFMRTHSCGQCGKTLYFSPEQR